MRLFSICGGINIPNDSPYEHEEGKLMEEESHKRSDTYT
jgi:hypothetical protein